MSVPVLVEPGRIEVEERPVPRPGPGELLLRVDAALTCGTDVKTYRRGHPKIPLPTPLGHELSGTVAAAGERVRGFREGDPVALVPTAPCGACRRCRAGRENLCPVAVEEMLLGAFAPYVLVPERLARTHVFPRPEGMDAVTAAGLEPLACVVHGASRLPAGAETAAIVGDGPIALLFLQLLRSRGVPRIAVVGRHADRLRAAEALGADRVVDAGPDDGRGAAAGAPAGRAGWEAPEGAGAPAALRDEIAGWTSGDGADIVVECVGRAEAWEAAAELAAPGGAVLMFGGCPAGSRVSLPTHRIHYEEVDVLGAFHFTPRDVREALGLLESGEVAVRPLVTAELPLEWAGEALELVMERRAIKVALRPGGPG